jgi:uncharacterized OsmC-like protein
VGRREDEVEVENEVEGEDEDEVGVEDEGEDEDEVGGEVGGWVWAAELHAQTSAITQPTADDANLRSMPQIYGMTTAPDRQPDFEVHYPGNLRTEMRHLRSGALTVTDAPVDNHGRGEAFSPTDLVASALASCMMTVMGIKANDAGWNIDGMRARVWKTMASGPRRIAAIHVELWVPAGSLSERDRTVLERTALTCPVAESLGAGVDVVLSITWG